MQEVLIMTSPMPRRGIKIMKLSHANTSVISFLFQNVFSAIKPSRIPRSRVSFGINLQIITAKQSSGKT